MAATASGAVATAAGWSWAALLIAYFVATSALGRVGRARKAERTRLTIAKGGARDWRQVLANGGPFVGAAALAALGRDAVPLSAFAAGALGAAAADSWATEIGTLRGGTPRSIRTGRPVPVGMSGGVTLVGSLGMLAGAALVALAAAALGWPARVALAAAGGGIAGAVVDTLLGAMLQARRHCSRCDVATEQVVHECGAPSIRAGGLAWLENDAVNLACTMAGGLLAAVLAR